MERRLTDKVAIVTGSTRGIGEGIARRLASEGAAVVISGRNVQDGAQVAKSVREAGGRATWTPADAGRPEDCENLIRSAVDDFGRLDILVNNAADLGVHPFDQITPEQWNSVFDVNVRGAFLLSRAAIPHMRRQGGGSIVNIGTTMAYKGSLDRLSYSCSKAALLGLTRFLARALLRDRIRVNWVTVGWVMTPREIELRDKTHGDGRAYLEERSRQMPLGRLETEEDIAAGVAYLVSDEASHVTACELDISGGIIL